MNGFRFDYHLGTFHFGSSLMVALVKGSAGLTIVVNVAIATGPALLGGPAVFCNKSYLLHYIDLFQSKKSIFPKFAISSNRRFAIESCVCPEILV